MESMAWVELMLLYLFMYSIFSGIMVYKKFLWLKIKELKDDSNILYKLIRFQNGYDKTFQYV